MPPFFCARVGIRSGFKARHSYFKEMMPPNKKPSKEENKMKRIAWFGLLLLASAQGAAAQGADTLNDQQKLGRQVFAQSCGVCHLPPSMGAKTYGPALNKEAGGGDDDVMREFITNGTP